jgi:hypothetical protein
MSAGATDHGKLRQETPRTYYEEVVRIPGFRESPERCRGLTPVGVCDHGHGILGRSSCGTKYCEEHWRDWCEEAVISGVARLAAYRWSREGAERRLSHVVASPPQDRRYSVREMWETRTDAYDALEQAGVRGGMTVVHPYRTTEWADRMYQTAKDHGEIEEGTGKWRFLRETADDWVEFQDYIEASPHYHGLAPGVDIRGEDAPDGWIVERVRTLKPFYHIRDTEAYRDMAQVAYYVLSHSAEQSGRQATTYFGEVHPNSFDPEEELTASEWYRIQKEAEAVVKEYSSSDGGSVGAGPEECPREDCEAPVHDVMHLPELLKDDDWVASIRRGRGGKARHDRLKGILLWWEGRCDTPPPTVRDSKSRMQEWLEEKGSVHTPNLGQVSLGAVLGD